MGALRNHTDTGARITGMTTAAVILTGFFAIELTTALAIGSIALLADAGTY